MTSRQHHLTLESYISLVIKATIVSTESMNDRLLLPFHVGMHSMSGSISCLWDERRRSFSENGREQRSSISDVIARCSDSDGFGIQHFIMGMIWADIASEDSRLVGCERLVVVMKLHCDFETCHPAIFTSRS